jgi:hypothetical protein
MRDASKLLLTSEERNMRFCILLRHTGADSRMNLTPHSQADIGGENNVTLYRPRAVAVPVDWRRENQVQRRRQMRSPGEFLNYYGDFTSALLLAKIFPPMQSRFVSYAGEHCSIMWKTMYFRTKTLQVGK